MASLACRERGYGPDNWVDLSNIDFESLKEKFAKGRKHTEAEKLKGSIKRKLTQMVRLNRSRMDYLDRFQKMIDEYNAGSMNIDAFFQQLMEFANNLNVEDQRTIREDLSEEELALFDVLIKPEPDLVDKDKMKVKKVARQLLKKLKDEKCVLDWRKRQQSRAAVKVSIEDLLDEGLPEVYTPELFQKKVDAVYQHVYEAYQGAGQSLYAGMALQ